MLLTLAATLALAASPPQTLRWEPRVDLPVTGVLVTGWLVSETALKKTLAPPGCRWCATNDFDTGVRRLFNPSLVPSSEGVNGPNVASTVLGFVVLPLGMLGLDALYSWQHDGGVEPFLIDSVLVLEATFSALAVNQLVKFSVGRARPYSIGATEAELAAAHDPTDHDLSFFSGHSTFSFAFVAASATLASLRGYKWAWVSWAVGLPLAATTAVLRLAADKHWATDVLVGTGIGLAAGILMPTLLHGRIGPVTAQIAPGPQGFAISGRF